MTRVAAVLVTSNAERWLEQTLASVLDQSRQPDRVIVIDDGSMDATREILDRMLGPRAEVHASRSIAKDLTSRVADNFQLGIKHARDCDVAVLGDHDDLWHADRVRHQVAVMELWDEVLMLASAGQLVDAAGVRKPGTLRSVFPVPSDFNDLSPAKQMRVVLRTSVATGGASAVRPAAFADAPIPEGWLHDRWWSLVATAREGLRVDDALVIDYRVSADQQVGLDRGRQGRKVLRLQVNDVVRARQALNLLKLRAN